LYKSLFRIGIILVVIVATLMFSLPAREPHKYTFEAYKLETAYSDKVFLDSDKYMFIIHLIDATIPPPINISFRLLTWDQFGNALQRNSYEAYIEKNFTFIEIGESKKFNLTLAPHEVYIFSIESPSMKDIHILIEIIPLGSEVITWKLSGGLILISIVLITPYSVKELFHRIKARSLHNCRIIDNYK